MDKFCFGVDIGGTSVKMGLFDERGSLYEKWSIATNLNEYGKSILADIAESIRDKQEKFNIRQENILGIGIGVPGPIQGDGIVYKCVNLGWDVVDVTKILEDISGLRVTVGNDASVAALGEAFMGSAKGYESVVMVTLGTGVGGGLIYKGEIINGAMGAGGEIGHINMSMSETQQCGCGNRGCLEQYASATGVVRRANQLLNDKSLSSEFPSSLRGKGNLTAEEIFNAAKEGDVIAQRTVEETGEMLGRAMAQIACIFNPRIFVIGGGMAQAGTILLDTIKKYFIKSAFHATKETEFVFASLGNDAGIYGGAKLIIG